jgi:ATP-dependent Lhr-like helicase
LVAQFELKRQRLAPGYSPETARELVDWVKERLLIPVPEWERLLRAMHDDHETATDELLESLTERLVRIDLPAASEALVVALENLPRITHALYGEQDVVIEPLIGSRATPTGREGMAANMVEDRDEILTDVLGEWFQYYGPVTYDFVQTTLGIEKQRLSLVLEDLIDSQKVIMGPLVTESTDERICDSENFEVLLRLARASASPVFEPLDVEWLPLFLAYHQGVTDPGDDVEGLFRCIEQLLCLPVPAALWESEILPARLHPYSASWLDSAMQEGDLRWVGSENHRVAFCFEPDLDLIQGDATGVTDTGESTGEDVGLTDVFPSTLGRYDFSTLITLSRHRPDELSDRLWEAVWQGRVTNDTFAALRRGIRNRFKVPNVAATATGLRHRGRRTGGRGGFARWKGSLPFAGNWFRLPAPKPDDDLLETEERMKDRARLLLDRYGILFRELLGRELPVFHWRNVFRALRLMELSGEVLAGYFFHGIPGPQFISHQAFRRLQRRLPEDVVYWINATDPTSLCGVQLEAIRGSLPKRIVGTHLIYRGTMLVAISRRNGRNLIFNVPPDDPYLPEYMSPLRHLLARQFQPVRRITIETINNEEAARSPYVDVLRTAFDVAIDYKNVILYHKAG